MEHVKRRIEQENLLNAHKFHAIHIKCRTTGAQFRSLQGHCRLTRLIDPSRTPRKGKQNKRIHFRLVPFYFVRHDRSSPLVGLASLGRGQLLAVLVVADTGRGSAVAAALAGADTGD